MWRSVLGKPDEILETWGLGPKQKNWFAVILISLVVDL